MTHRERWVRTMHFQPVDHIPDEEFGYWDETFWTWHEQGLPREVQNNAQADRYFCFAPRSYVPVHLGLIPPFETKVLEETSSYRIVQDGNGVIKKIHRGPKDSIPHFLEFPLKTRKDWEEKFLPRLRVDQPERYPENRPDWEQLKARFNSPDWEYPVGINIGSLFGWLRDWMGFEHILYTMYDDPEWMHQMIEHLAELFVTVIRRAVEEIRIDFAGGWEDMAFRQGPMISPEMFREFLTPRYKRITDLLRAHGVDVIYYDCDGRVIEAIEPWLEGGVNAIFPCEVGAEREMTDPIRVREKYGQRVLILGGVNKHALIAGKESIRAEIKRIEPYVREGGWIPHVDHRCPPTVSFENYLYYLDVKRDTFGIPRPEEFESRPEIRRIKSRPGYWP
ncbi:MAG: hypothetical protein KatS3mg115_2359 [Candidatus Poribacteria bacterium]|nr:MAG: hypothetical protein KatS3mg115_2359 [Candidatus Poribacteria bacterium]